MFTFLTSINDFLFNDSHLYSFEYICFESCLEYNRMTEIISHLSLFNSLLIVISGKLSFNKKQGN